MKTDTAYLGFRKRLEGTIEFFTNSPQYKNANIANFVLALPLKISWAIMPTLPTLCDCEKHEWWILQQKIVQS